LLNQQNVFFTGKIFDERMMALAYNAADYFLLPSLEDNLPNTLLESLACGVPVISFDISDLKAIVEHNQLGIVAKETSSKGLQTAMIQAIHEDNFSNKQGVSAAAHKIFNTNNIIQQHLAVYAKLI
jgi:glycosyltransferase involved in cell wall biosynthesis